MNEEKLQIELNKLKEENEKLIIKNEIMEEEIERLSNRIDDKDDKLNQMTNYSWAEFFTQEEIDVIVEEKIAKEMVSYYTSFDFSANRIIKECIEMCESNVVNEFMPYQLQALLKLGLRSKSVLPKSIFLFLGVVLEMDDDEMMFVMGD